MAAPQSSPDLTVVEPESNETVREVSEPTKVAPPAAEAAEPTRTSRRGVPIWALAVVAAIGLVLFLSQYQRAQTLDAQVVALEGELVTVGEQLQAYQAHLGDVRTSVSSLQEQIGSLDALVNLDPLAPSVDEVVELSAPAFMPSEPAPVESAADAKLTTPELDPVVGSALATPVASSSREDLGPFGATGSFQGPGF